MIIPQNQIYYNRQILAVYPEVDSRLRLSRDSHFRENDTRGGKDATPYPLDRPTYDQTIEMLKDAVRKSKIKPIEKDKALKRLANLPNTSV